jgi:biotin operon repressor
MIKLVDYLKELQEGKKVEISKNLGYVLSVACIRRCKRVSEEEKMVFHEILALYNEDKKCAFPTQLTLGMYLGLSASSINRHIESLEKKGFVTSRGRKGTKKSYVPSFELHLNPYLILSETFDWYVGTLQNNLPGGIDGKWCELLLRFVNVPQQKQFTEDDQYGYFLNELKYRPGSHRQIQLEFLNALSLYLSGITETKFEIEWEKELASFKASKLARDQKKANSKTGTLWNKPEKKSSTAIEKTWVDTDDDFLFKNQKEKKRLKEAAKNE